MVTLKVILHPINKDKDGKRAIVLRMTHFGIKYLMLIRKESYCKF